MKNTFFKLITPLGLFVFAVITFNTNTSNLNQNDLTLDNILALNSANAEFWGGGCLTCTDEIVAICGRTIAGDTYYGKFVRYDPSPWNPCN
ncbi:hypothetical protein [Flavivirga eckloniae]|uniref:Uncharacterized protein n=1 Tax=Flavivirga eckloniae TaxID=1803846 RepID=A0A2K9PQ25_9FLAO|nr:hypothetical protein [Flavivirga eckloniae]AUP78667.1 hypothetical protein C1H87_08080 [Flavivirga eckloniae]